MEKDILKQAINNCTMLDGRTNWLLVQEFMEENGYEGSTEKWRSKWRRMNPTKKRLVSDVGIDEIERRKQAGENIVVWFEDGELWCETRKKLPIGTTEVNHITQGREIHIALVSDTHIGSDKFAEEELREFYHFAHEQGVTEFYHFGDLTDGMYKNRDNSFYEQDCHGFQQQLDKVVSTYPKIDGCVTYFITGNHDVTHMRNGGANIGETVAAMRDDMVYLGHNFAKVWLTENVDMNLIHPTDGSTQTISYKLQKIIDNARGLRQAKITGVGHYHKMNFMLYKGTYGLLLPSFQHQTDFMRDNNLMSYVGGYILHIKLDRDGNILSFIPEFIDMGKDY